MFEASEALQKMEGMKKIKSTSFHQYSWNSEVETTWISLIGWHHKTSTTYLPHLVNIGKERPLTKTNAPHDFFYNLVIQETPFAASIRCQYVQPISESIFFSDRNSDAKVRLQKFRLKKMKNANESKYLHLFFICVFFQLIWSEFAAAEFWHSWQKIRRLQLLDLIDW